MVAGVREHGLEESVIGDLSALEEKKKKINIRSADVTTRHASTYAEGRELQPEDESRLEGKVPGEIVQNNTEGKGLDEVQEAEDGPVGEPLHIILSTRRLDRLEGEVRGETPTYEIRGRRGERVDEMEDNDKEKTTDNGICLRYLGPGLNSLQNGVVLEL